MLERVETPEGRLELRQRGERDFLITIGGRVLMTSAAHRSEDDLAKLACAAMVRRPRPRVLLGGLGMGYNPTSTRPSAGCLPASRPSTPGCRIPRRSGAGSSFPTTCRIERGDLTANLKLRRGVVGVRLAGTIDELLRRRRRDRARRTRARQARQLRAACPRGWPDEPVGSPPDAPPTGSRQVACPSTSCSRPRRRASAASARDRRDVPRRETGGVRSLHPRRGGPGREDRRGRRRRRDARPIAPAGRGARAAERGASW